MTKEGGRIIEGRRESKRIAKQTKRRIIDSEEEEEEEFKNHTPPVQQEELSQEMSEGAASSSDQVADDQGSSGEDIQKINFGFGARKNAKQDSESDASGRISDGLDIDGLDAMFAQDERQQATKAAIPQAVAQPAAPQRSNRQARITGQKRTSRLCKNERRDDSSESFDLEESSDEDQYEEENRGYKAGAKRDCSDSEAASDESDLEQKKKEVIAQQKKENYSVSDDKAKKAEQNYLHAITGGQSSVKETTTKRGRKKLGNEYKGSGQDMTAINLYNANKSKAEALTEREYEQRLADEAVEGSLETHEVRAIRVIHFKDRKMLDILAEVSWWPTRDDPGLNPLNSLVAYRDLRERAPQLLIEYFQRRIKLR